MLPSRSQAEYSPWLSKHSTKIPVGVSHYYPDLNKPGLNPLLPPNIQYPITFPNTLLVPVPFWDSRSHSCSPYWSLISMSNVIFSAKTIFIANQVTRNITSLSKIQKITNFKLTLILSPTLLSKRIDVIFLKIFILFWYIILKMVSYCSKHLIRSLFISDHISFHTSSLYYLSESVSHSAPNRVVPWSTQRRGWQANT